MRVFYDNRAYQYNKFYIFITFIIHVLYQFNKSIIFIICRDYLIVRLLAFFGNNFNLTLNRKFSILFLCLQVTELILLDKYSINAIFTSCWVWLLCNFLYSLLFLSSYLILWLVSLQLIFNLLTSLIFIFLIL